MTTSTQVSRKEPVTIALVDDDRPFRGYVAALIASEPGWSVSLEADTAEAALAAGRSLRPQVLLLDIALPGRSGAEAVADFVALWPEVKTIMLTAHEDDDLVLASIRAGASGYLLKGASSGAMLAAIADARAGGAPMSPAIARKVLALLRTSPSAPAEAAAKSGAGAPTAVAVALLTPREHEVVALVADGLSDKEIATRLETAVSTVKNHLASVYGKWRVRSRTEAAVRFTKSTGG